MIFFNLDISDLIEMRKDFTSKMERVANDAARDLAVQTHAHIVEQVQEKLHSTRQKYLDSLSMTQIDSDTWVISLDSKAMFIEEGIPPNKDMLDGLLRSPKAKTAKDGSRYLVVPFEHKKGKTSQTHAQATLTDTLKREMKRRNIPYGKLETDSAGKAKTGLLHSFDVMRAPLKTSNKPGQGKGAIGSPMVGPTGIPFLQGVRVYQNKVKGADGQESVKKSIMTFRVASSKHRGQGRWIHPGLEAKKFFDEAAEWALKEFEERIKSKAILSITKNF